MIKLITHSDIVCDEIQNVIADELNKYNKFVFLSATINLKAMRMFSPSLQNDFKGNDSETPNLLTVTEFIQSISKMVYKGKNALSKSDQKFILTKVLMYKYQDDQPKYNAMYAVRHDLFELYSTLMFNNAEVTENMILDINSCYSLTEADIFDIYRIFNQTVKNIIEYYNTGCLDDGVPLIMGKSFIKRSNKKKIALFAQRQKEMIEQYLEGINAVFFDGFLFFDDIQRFIIKTAISAGKDVYFISKQFADGTGDFIFTDTFQRIADELNTNIESIYTGKNEIRCLTALDYIRQRYPIHNSCVDENIKQKVCDGSIRFIAPFLSREEELRFVTKSISDRLRSAYDGSLTSVTQVLSEIAIILAVNKDQYEQRISNLFTDVGLFVFKGPDSLSKQSVADVDVSTFNEVCFTKDEFLNSTLKTSAGQELSFSEKHDLFEKCFYKIDINRHTRPISSYPIGQFVICLYDIVQYGMNLESFKCILYSNWKYNLGTTPIKWSDFLSDFKYIEIWFENKTEINEWKEIADKLITLKTTMDENHLYIYHPLKAVKSESLAFLKALLFELSEMLDSITSVSGGINKHLSVLKDVVMKADEIMALDVNDLEFEQAIIKRLLDVVTDISSSSLVSSLDSIYFAENLRAMLKDYDEEQEADESPLKIASVNLENMKSYKTCYFVMCESDKYPRPYYDTFPYTNDINQILTDKKYGINTLPFDHFGLEYHLKLERYLLKNVLDFTQEELIITFAEKETNSIKNISVFAENIATAFDADITFESINTRKEVEHDTASEILSAAHLPPKPIYALTELAVFKLCPKAYYHRETDSKSAYLSRLQLRFYAEAVMYCDLFQRFMDYNLENKKVYHKDDNSYIAIIEKLHRQCITDNANYFTFFSQYELSDTARNVLSKILSFVENSKQYIKGDSFTVITYTDIPYLGNGYSVIAEHDNRVVDYDKKTWRMSQNKTYLEFLVLKTSDRKSDIVHYKDMIKALDDNNPNEDRINLTSRIIAKINIQFDSNKFAADGIARTDALVDELLQYDFSHAAAMPSNYCSYCRFIDVCTGR